MFEFEWIAGCPSWGSLKVLVIGHTKSSLLGLGVELICTRKKAGSSYTEIWDAKAKKN